MDMDVHEKTAFVIEILQYLTRDLTSLFEIDPPPSHEAHYERTKNTAQSDELYTHFGFPLICRAWSVLIKFGIVEGLDNEGHKWGGSEFPPVLKISIAIEDIKSHITSNFLEIPDNQTIDDCLAGLIIIADWMARFPTSRQEFSTERLDHYKQLIIYLENFGYLQRDFVTGAMEWTDAASHTMQLAGVWNTNNIALVDFQRAMAFSIWNAMPKQLLRQAFRTNSKTELRQFIHEHLDKTWHTKKLANKQTDYSEIYLMNIIYPQFEQARTKIHAQHSRNIRIAVCGLIIFGTTLLRALIASSTPTPYTYMPLVPATMSNGVDLGSSLRPLRGVPIPEASKVPCFSNQTTQSPFQSSGILLPLPTPCLQR